MIVKWESHCTIVDERVLQPILKWQIANWLQNHLLGLCTYLPSGCYRYQESHHFYVSRNWWRTSELSIWVHTTHSICHTYRSRTSSHVILGESTTCTTTWSYWEVWFTCKKNTFFLVSTCNWVLETSRVSRVTCDRNVYTFFPHDSYTFANVVSTVAFYFARGPSE